METSDIDFEFYKEVVKNAPSDAIIFALSAMYDSRMRDAIMERIDREHLLEEQEDTKCEEK